MIKLPLVSVLILTYNHEKYAEKAIQSVIAQKCSFQFELIISDDCSTDNTRIVLSEMQLKYPDLIRVITNHTNLGVSVSFINAVKAAKGEYISSLAGDDYWIVDDKLELQVQLLRSNTDIACVHTAYQSLNDSDHTIALSKNKPWCSVLTRKTGKDALEAMLCHQWTRYPLGSSSCYLKAPLLKGFELHPEVLTLHGVGEGTFLHASLCYYGGLYAYLPYQTTMYRIRENSLCHFPNGKEQFDFNIKYYLLRIFTAESFGLGKREIRRIKKKGMYTLLLSALQLDVLNEFEKFFNSIQYDNHDFKHYKSLLWMLKCKITKCCIKYILQNISALHSKIRNFRCLCGSSI